jgi:hypothetical protein
MDLATTVREERTGFLAQIDNTMFIVDAEEAIHFLFIKFFSLASLLAGSRWHSKSQVYKGPVSFRFSLIPLRIPPADNLFSEST